MQTVSPPLAKLPEIMLSLIQKVCSLQTALKYTLWNALTSLRLYLANENNYHGKTHTHKPQMPISTQQWRLSVGRANASRSLRPLVTGQPKMKLTSWHILIFIINALLGAILVLLSLDGGRGTGERSERSE